MPDHCYSDFHHQQQTMHKIWRLRKKAWVSKEVIVARSSSKSALYYLSFYRVGGVKIKDTTAAVTTNSWEHYYAEVSGHESCRGFLRVVWR